MTTPFVELLEPSSLADLEAQGSLVRYRKRSYLFHEGDRSDSVLLLRKGLLKISMSTPEGRSILIALRGGGAIVGEMAALGEGARMASAMTLEDTEALVVRGSVFAELAETDNRIAMALVRMLSDRLSHVSAKLVDFTTSDALTRVSASVVDLIDDDHLAGIHAELVQGKHAPFVVDLPLSQEELGESIGLSREAVVKALRKLRDDGYIETSRRKITINDLPGLHAASGAVNDLI